MYNNGQAINQFQNTIPQEMVQQPIQLTPQIEQRLTQLANNYQEPQFQQQASLPPDIQEKVRVSSTPKHYVINNPRVQLQEPVLEYNYGDGRDYVSAVPNISDPKFNQEIVEAGGLDKIIEKYPYQQLKIDDNGKLAAVNPNCGYDPTITNAYHVMYHSNLNKAADKQKKRDAVMEDIAPGSTTPNIFISHYNRPGAIAKKLVDIDDMVSHQEEPTYGIDLSKLVDMEGDKPENLYGYEKIEQAYHMEPEVKVADYRVLPESHIVINPKTEETYFIDNNRLPEYVDVSNPTNMVFKHPNPDYNKSQVQINQQLAQQNNQQVGYYNQPMMTQYPSQSSPGFTYDNGINPNIFGWKNNDQNVPFGSTETIHPGSGLVNILIPNFDPNHGPGYIDTEAQPSQPNVVNFGNMNTAKARLTNNAVANNMRNPNIQYGPNSYNPYQERNNSWFNNYNAYNGGTFYNYNPSYYNYGRVCTTPGKNPIQTVFSHLTDFDYKHGLGIKVKFGKQDFDQREENFKLFGRTPEPRRKLTYLEKLTQVPKVSFMRFKVNEKGEVPEDLIWDESYNMKCANAIAEAAKLMPSNEESELMKDHPLKLDEDDKKIAEQVADQMDEWDHFYAEVIRVYAEETNDDTSPFKNVISWMKQEHFDVLIRLARGHLKWLQGMEIKDKSRLYHKDYRYIKRPVELIDPATGNKKYPIRGKDHYQLREVKKDGTIFHEVDNGEELSNDLWTAFFNDMNTQIRHRVETIRTYERAMVIINIRERMTINDVQNVNKNNSKQGNSIYGYELDGSNYGKDQDTQNENSSWMNNNYMSYGARMYYERQEKIRKEHQQMVENQKMVFRKAFGNKMTEKEFNNFWYGPQNNPDNQLDPVWKRQQELASVTRANIELLSKAKPYPENSEQLLTQYEIKKIREMDKGCMENTKTLKDYFDNFAYLASLVDQEERKEEEKKKGSILYRMNQKMKANLGWLREDMSRSVNLMKEALGIDDELLKKVSEDCYKCLSSESDGNSYIDMTKNEEWNKKRKVFIQQCQLGTQDPMLARYTPLPFPQ